ncbi:hypothetical protein RintRC_5444 [Richelia intracellularis]|nr:hypothetical protein RintRC_5444 [Richelia intracellularis]
MPLFFYSSTLHLTFIGKLFTINHLSNAKYLKYDDYFKAGFPMATGLIEGACLHLIKDRMDITGARCTMTGAEAVLPLGSLYISGDWDEYCQFHLQEEHKRNHLLCILVVLLCSSKFSKLVVLLPLHLFQYLSNFHSPSY